VFGEPAQPAAEGAPVFVDGDYAWAGGAVEGCVGEDEAEGGEVFDEGAGLGAEDFAGYAAAVQAEDAWVVEGWVWSWRCGSSGVSYPGVSWFVEVEVKGFLSVGEMEEIKDERDALYALQINRTDMTAQI
jgi:hypothetical protein